MRNRCLTRALCGVLACAGLLSSLTACGNTSVPSDTTQVPSTTNSPQTTDAPASKEAPKETEAETTAPIPPPPTHELLDDLFDAQCYIYTDTPNKGWAMTTDDSGKVTALTANAMQRALIVSDQAIREGEISFSIATEDMPDTTNVPRFQAGILFSGTDLDTIDDGELFKDRFVCGYDGYFLFFAETKFYLCAGGQQLASSGSAVYKNNYARIVDPESKRLDCIVSFNEKGDVRVSAGGVTFIDYKPNSDAHPAGNQVALAVTNYATTANDSRADITFSGVTLNRTLGVDHGAPVEKTEISAGGETMKDTTHLYFADPNELPLEQFPANGGYCGIFRTIGIIGDSLAAGVVESTDAAGNRVTHTMPEHAWGTHLARATGSTVLNFSRGGMTAKEYVESYADSLGYWGEDKLCQAYILALGFNDVNRQHPMGSISDVDFSDYTKNAETFIGYYASIIQRLQSMQPKACFFVMTMPRTESSKEGDAGDQHAALLHQLAEKIENVYVIDFREYAPVHNAKFRSDYYLGGHMNPMGYILTARMTESYIDYIIRHNIKDFKQVQFIGTPYYNSKA